MPSLMYSRGTPHRGWHGVASLLGPASPHSGLYDENECITSTTPMLNCKFYLGKKGPLLVSSLVHWHNLAYNAISKGTVSFSGAQNVYILMGEQRRWGHPAGEEKAKPGGVPNPKTMSKERNLTTGWDCPGPTECVTVFLAKKQERSLFFYFSFYISTLTSSSSPLLFSWLSALFVA